MADWGTLAAESFNSAFEAARKRGAQKRETEAAIIIEDLKLKQKTQENKQQNQLDMLKAGFTPTQDNDPNPRMKLSLKLILTQMMYKYWGMFLKAVTWLYLNHLPLLKHGYYLQPKLIFYLRT
jgi:hypothetical protein